MKQADIYAGKQLRKLRTVKGLSQEQLGRALNITFQQIQKYESAKNRLSVSRLHDICLVLDIMPGVFFDFNKKGRK